MATDVCTYIMYAVVSNSILSLPLALAQQVSIGVWGLKLNTTISNPWLILSKNSYWKAMCYYASGKHQIQDFWKSEAHKKWCIVQFKMLVCNWYNRSVVVESYEQKQILDSLPNMFATTELNMYAS